MNIKNIAKYAFLNASLTALYVGAVSWLLVHLEKYFSAFGQANSKSIFIPIFMLMLLVFSAALTGSLIFGRPALWYLDGRKKEAVWLFAVTLGIFFIFPIIVLLVMAARV